MSRTNDLIYEFQTPNGLLERRSIVELITGIGTKYWRDVLHNASNPILKTAWRLFLGRRRADIHLIHSPERTERALVVFGGTGSIPDALANYFDDVYTTALDPVIVQFLRIRFDQDHKTNIHLLQTDPLNLPLSSDAFDLISIDGGFVPLLSRYRDESPPQTIFTFLSRCSTLLRPGGRIIIGAPNIISAQGLKNWKGPTNRMSFSIRQYKRLLKDAGFNLMTTYSALPNHLLPTLLIPHGDRKITYLAFESTGRLPKPGWRRLITLSAIHCGLYRHLVSGFFLIGEKA
jgi:SAM-dependent methyltransferase